MADLTMCAATLQETRGKLKSIRLMQEILFIQISATGLQIDLHFKLYQQVGHLDSHRGSRMAKTGCPVAWREIGMVDPCILASDLGIPRLKKPVEVLGQNWGFFV